jgi:hypothetical protein
MKETNVEIYFKFLVEYNILNSVNAKLVSRKTLNV